MTLNCSLFISIIYSMTLSESNIGLLDRVNIANCASQRAHMHVFDDDRFNGEFQTIRLWTRYKCYISTRCSFVEFD
jgi:hypothetical protein